MTVGSFSEESGCSVHRIVSIRRDTLVESEYELLEEIGRGKFGRVVRCRHLGSGHCYAAKLLRCPQRQERLSVEREVDVMNALDHHAILKLVDAFEHNRMDMCLITELVEGGELFERVVDDAFELSERLAKDFMTQILSAVVYMHQQSIVHLDLKPENIMCVDAMGDRVKLIDFGLARRLSSDKREQVLFGTPEFVAPEVVAFEPINFATDMWAIGVILYVLLSGLSPFMGDTDLETMANVTLAEFDFEDEAFLSVSSEGKDLIDKLLVKNMRKRYTAQQCLEHPWFKTQVMDDERPSLVEDDDDVHVGPKNHHPLRHYQDYYAFHVPSHTMTHVNVNNASYLEWASDKETTFRPRRSRSVISLDQVMAKADEMRLARHQSASHDDLSAAKKPKLNIEFNHENENLNLQSVDLVLKAQNEASIPTTVVEINEKSKSSNQETLNERQGNTPQNTTNAQSYPNFHSILLFKLRKSVDEQKLASIKMEDPSEEEQVVTSRSLPKSLDLSSPRSPSSLMSPKLVRSPSLVSSSSPSLDHTFADLLSEVERQLQEVREAKRRSREAREQWSKRPPMEVGAVITTLAMESNPWLLADIVGNESKRRDKEEEEMDAVMRSMRETIEMCTLNALTSFGLHLQLTPAPPPRRRPKFDTRAPRNEQPMLNNVINHSDLVDGSDQGGQMRRTRGDKQTPPTPPPRSRSRDALCRRCRALLATSSPVPTTTAITSSRRPASSSTRRTTTRSSSASGSRVMRGGVESRPEGSQPRLPAVRRVSSEPRGLRKKAEQFDNRAKVRSRPRKWQPSLR